MQELSWKRVSVRKRVMVQCQVPDNQGCRILPQAGAWCGLGGTACPSLRLFLICQPRRKLPRNHCLWWHSVKSGLGTTPPKKVSFHSSGDVTCLHAVLWDSPSPVCRNQKPLRRRQLCSSGSLVRAVFSCSGPSGRTAPACHACVGYDIRTRMLTLSRHGAEDIYRIYTPARKYI